MYVSALINLPVVASGTHSFYVGSMCRCVHTFDTKCATICIIKSEINDEKSFKSLHNHTKRYYQDKEDKENKKKAVNDHSNQLVLTHAQYSGTPGSLHNLFYVRIHGS